MGSVEAWQLIEWLRRSTILARQTDLPIEAFYGWGRQNMPEPVADLANFATEKLPFLLSQLMAVPDEKLRSGLEAAITEDIIPANFRDRINEIMAQLERLRIAQGLLTARRFIGRLTNESSGEPLIGLVVRGFDLDTGREPKDLGQNVSNHAGLFFLNYVTPPPAGEHAEQSRRRLRLQVLINPQTQEWFETEIQAGGDQDILTIPVPMPAPREPESHQLTNLASTLPIELPPDLLPFLAGKDLNSLADIRRAGGLSRLEGLPVTADHPAVQLLEAHADLSRISPDVQVNALMIENRYDSVAAIAQAARPDFVGAIHERIGDFKAAQLQVAARAQTQFLNNLMFDRAANQANGGGIYPMMAEQTRCRCRDCEAAVSPLAYLADLLKYATENVKDSNVPVTAASLSATFCQPFDLPVSCETADAQIRQVRLCVEALRRFLGTRPLADAAIEATLADAEKAYRLAAYTALLTRIGTNYAELRLSRTSEPALRQSLADRLGIDVGRLKGLFLDSDNPETFTEAELEGLFGLADTKRDPLSKGAKLGDKENQIYRWTLNNIQPGDNTDPRGRVYTKLYRIIDELSLAPLGVGVELYKDVSLQSLAARGEINNIDGGMIQLLPANNSRLYGVFFVDYDHNSPDPFLLEKPISIATTPEFLIWRLQHLRTMWNLQDFPTDGYEDGQNAVALEQLPTGVAFTPPLDTQISYDTDRQQLICKGEMAHSDRSALLSLSPDLNYQLAVKQLFQTSQRPPIIDPDLIGPDDFRHPFLKSNPGALDQAFDLWKKRRDWVDGRLKFFSALMKPVSVGGQTIQVPDIVAMFAAMYQPVTYGATSVTAWANTTLSAEFKNLLDQLSHGVDIKAIAFRLQDDLNLAVENFTRLMAIAIKAKAWEEDTRGEKVKDDEWREVYSILVQAQKKKLFATWRKEESEVGVQLDLHNFWLSLRQPREGDWPPILESGTPLIDPATVKLKDLPEPTAGERALAIWQARQTRLEQIPKDLATKRETEGFDAMLRLALGHPKLGDPLQHDLTTLKTELSSPDPTVVAGATSRITDDLHLSVEDFKRLLAIKAKHDDPDPAKKPTAAEWAGLNAILTPARKVKHEFPLWIAEEQNPLTGVVYWNALKATLPRWRASDDGRQLWQQALRNRSLPAIIDPDLIGPADLKNPVPGDPAFDLWKVREVQIGTQLTQLAAKPKTLAGLDRNFQSILGMSVAQFLTIAADQDKGYGISDRLAQLSLERAEFNYLLRIARLAKQTQPILDSEWQNAYSILIQVWKRRQSTEWREAEKAQNIPLSPDFFQIPPPEPIQFPPKEPTAADRWRSSETAFQDWRNKLQTRLDQEKTVIQALTEAVGAAEEATLPNLRDALVLALNLDGDLEVKAKWVIENLLIDASMSACSMTTRVAQTIESLQGLILALRTGQLKELYKTFTLNLDNFDEKWKWLGSYASWRAAVFVFLYPENILQPSLRKPEWQSPAFKTLVNNTRSGRTLNSDDTCKEAKRYAEYFQDICKLRVEATCVSSIRLAKGDKCNQTDIGYRSQFYLFGRGGSTGKVYWSARDSQDWRGQAPTFWEQVVSGSGNEIKGFDNIIEIIGAVPYTVSPEQRYIFLIARRQKGTLIQLACAKYDLENQYWLEEALDLAISPDLRIDPFSSAAIRQIDSENEPPQVAFMGGSDVYVEKLNSNGNQWDANSLDQICSSEKINGMVSAGSDAFYLITTLSSGTVECLLYMPRTVVRPAILPSSRNYKPVAKFSLAFGFERMRYLGAFSWPGTNDVYVLTEVQPSGWVWLWRLWDTGSSTLSVELFSSPLGYLYPTRLAPIAGFDNRYPVGLSKLLVYQADLDVAAAHDVIRYAPLEQGTLYVGTGVLVMPKVAGHFDIPGQLDTQALQLRKGLIQGAFANNQAGPLSNLVYLEEAYYFVPIHLALALQRSGEYIDALNWFRTVYDYTAELGSRKIYYGLAVEESLPAVYERGPYWLLDPLNPHAIAATRKDSYTRFTLLAIIRCLMDYADAEFTLDTAESNPRARRLYLTALELLETQELKQSLNKCDDIIGLLDDIRISDDRWQNSIQHIKGELKAIPDPQRLRPVVKHIQQALMTSARLEQRFADARAIIKQAIAGLPPDPTLTVAIQENKEISLTVQRSGLADALLAAALDSVSALATEDFRRAVTMVTGISAARLEQRSIDLHWLREPNPLAGNLDVSQPGATQVTTRSDVAQFDIFAPTYTATLAHVAARQPIDAVNLVVQVQAVHIPQLIVSFCVPPNPVLKTLHLRAESNLHKLRTCRNIAGLQRQLEPYAAPTDTNTGLPTTGAGEQLLLPGAVRLQPTLYRYAALIERAKQLAQLAGQIETALFSTLVQRDFEAYNLLKARQEMNLAQANVQLQNLRIREAQDGVALAEKQKMRAEKQLDTYQSWIEAAPNEYEKEMINAYEIAAKAQKGGGGPRCLDSLMGGISSESVFGFFNFIGKHQAASAKG